MVVGERGKATMGTCCASGILSPARFRLRSACTRSTRGAPPRGAAIARTGLHARNRHTCIRLRAPLSCHSSLWYLRLSHLCASMPPFYWLTWQNKTPRHLVSSLIDGCENLGRRHGLCGCCLLLSCLMVRSSAPHALPATVYALLLPLGGGRGVAGTRIRLV